jgi:hypothetical protein
MLPSFSDVELKRVDNTYHLLFFEPHLVYLMLSMYKPTVRLSPYVMDPH